MILCLLEAVSMQGESDIVSAGTEPWICGRFQKFVSASLPRKLSWKNSEFKLVGWKLTGDLRRFAVLDDLSWCTICAQEPQDAPRLCVWASLCCTTEPTLISHIGCIRTKVIPSEEGNNLFALPTTYRFFLQAASGKFFRHIPLHFLEKIFEDKVVFPLATNVFVK